MSGMSGLRRIQAHNFARLDRRRDLTPGVPGALRQSLDQGSITRGAFAIRQIEGILKSGAKHTA
jgi:hypothetical protein